MEPNSNAATPVPLKLLPGQGGPRDHGPATPAHVLLTEALLERFDVHDQRVLLLEGASAELSSALARAGAMPVGPSAPGPPALVLHAPLPLDPDRGDVRLADAPALTRAASLASTLLVLPLSAAASTSQVPEALRRRLAALGFAAELLPGTTVLARRLPAPRFRAA